MILADIPSPTISAIHLGPLEIHFYALCILAGIGVALWWATKRWESRGGKGEDMFDIVFAAVVAGIIGARIWHVLSSPAPYFGADGNLLDVLKIWQGGLAIYGAVAGGAVAVWFMARRKGISFVALADTIAPTLMVAQAIGRLGNWFNQELYGPPTTLPWGLDISCVQNGGTIPGCMPGTYHPTFLYELLWNLIGVVVLLAIAKRLQLGGGRVFWLYAAIYSAGRAWIDAMRTEPVAMIGPLRIHTVLALVVLVIAIVVLVVLTRRRRAGGGEVLAADGSWTLPAGSTAGPAASADGPTPEASPAPADPSSAEDADGADRSAPRSAPRGRRRRGD
ncbi:prolipoprotein diacylglyceryl transferase [Brachybacterium halotolerans subsp. kimchii]|uniref:prolipoprotein diacylglyceryl transferase n=1 Tax=Brachybacterium halotolerans TaxID=2795215 RepID=UPI001E2BA6D1|nr:prolipoprotein diacylglyceryl transferase [Brachybacterium halotolerans]UEJ83283.1 prolipoprotein diacylglyceryl transferase [Brachybacterium halotolerans subsp. kimchii]